MSLKHRPQHGLYTNGGDWSDPSTWYDTQTNQPANRVPTSNDDVFVLGDVTGSGTAGSVVVGGGPGTILVEKNGALTEENCTICCCCQKCESDEDCGTCPNGQPAQCRQPTGQTGCRNCCYCVDAPNGCCCLKGALRTSVTINDETIGLHELNCEYFGGTWVSDYELCQSADPSYWTGFCPACCCTGNGESGNDNIMTKPECENLLCPGVWIRQDCYSPPCREQGLTPRGTCCVGGDIDPSLKCQQACNAAGGTWWPNTTGQPAVIPGGGSSDVVCGPASCCWYEPVCRALCEYCNNRQTDEYTLVGGDPALCPQNPNGYNPGGNMRFQLVGLNTWCQGNNPTCEDADGIYAGFTYGLYELGVQPYCETGEPGDIGHWQNCNQRNEWSLRGDEQYRNVSYIHNRGCPEGGGCPPMEMTEFNPLP